MTFKDVALKNFSSHLRRYLSFFFCSSLTIMVFFIYSTMVFNKSFVDFATKTDFIYMIDMGIVTVFLFSVFFINYAHGAFVKSRSSEFALLMVLGLTKKNIGRMIWIENIIILASSMATGLVTGALFSRLFFLIISRLIEDASLSYHLDYRSFAVTGIVFIIIYVIAITLSRNAVTKFSIVQLLKKPREGLVTKGRAWAGILGIILFLGALILVIVAAQQKDFTDQGYIYVIYGVISFFSLYLILSHVGCLYLKYIRRNKKRYYDHLLSFSEIEYSFTQNKKIIFILSLLSAMILFFVASPFSLLAISKQMAEETRVADVQYVELGSINSIEEEKLQEILQQGDTPLVREKEQEFLALSYKVGEEVIVKPVISETLYKELNEEAVPVNRGEVLEVVITWIPGYDELKDIKKITLSAQEVNSDYKMAGKVTGKGINMEVFPSKITLVLEDADYLELKSKLNSDAIGRVRQFDFKNWEKVDSIILTLQQNLNNPSGAYPVDSILAAYRISRNMFSMMIFIDSFMGLLFFFSAGSILFFKQYGDIEQYKKTYKKLSQLGLTKRELMKIHASAQKSIFFTPLLFGTVIGFAFIYITTFMMGGGDTIATFFRNSIMVALLYGLFQMVFFLFSMRRFQQNI